LFYILDSGKIVFYKAELSRGGWACRWKELKKAETENIKQIGHFKVTFLVKVKLEGTSSSCRWFGYLVKSPPPSPPFLGRSDNNLISV
jgi:hypothetical protein